MSRKFLSIETARLAEEKGFDFTGYPVVGNLATEYRRTCSPPVLRDWLKKNHGIHIIIIPYIKNYQVMYKSEIGLERDTDSEKIHIDWLRGYIRMESYEKAVEETLKDALKKI